MATRRLYYDDAFEREFSARVLHCELLPPDVNSGITTQVLGLVLDRTAFYPTSGGQPHDLGKIGDANVLDVRDDGEEIIHIVDRRPGSPDVLGCISWPRRFDHMQQHTGQHLLSAMFQERFGLPTVSFHLGAEICTIDLRGPQPTEEILEGVQRAANQVIFENRPITVRYGTSEQLAKLGVRKEVPREGILRAIEIESADLQPCGGTHVKSTGQIGLILVRRCTKVRQDWRVEFVCGGRAGRVARHDFSTLLRAAEKLDCAPDELVSAAERTIEARDANHKRVLATYQQLAQAEARLLMQSMTPAADGKRIVLKEFPEAEPEYLGPLATQLAGTENVIALVGASVSGNLVFAQHSSAGKDMNALLKSIFQELGGKGGGSRDFARGRLSDAAKTSQALSRAAELLSAGE
jgi:alanyl-tRNA synthetase